MQLVLQLEIGFNANDSINIHNNSTPIKNVYGNQTVPHCLLHIAMYFGPKGPFMLLVLPIKLNPS